MNIIPTEKEIEELLQAGQLPLAVLQYDFPEGYEFIRARYHNSEDRPETISDIYYPPDPKKIDIGRANDWNQQVFYGMLPTGGRGPRIAACQEIADEINPIPTFTVSHWRLKKPLTPVLSLVMHEAQSMGNEFARLTYHRNMEYLGDTPPAYRDNFKESLNGIGSLFARRITDCSYKRTADLANYYFSIGYKAILYPSVSYDYRAVCIAIPKDLADEYLEPTHGGLTQIHIKNGWADECCYYAFHVEGTSLKWVDNHEEGERPPFTPSIKPMREDVCKALRDLHNQQRPME